MELFVGIKIEDTRECLLSALRKLRDPDAARTFEQNFRSLERLWEAVSPDPCLYPYRFQYNWLCGIYVAYRRRQRGTGRATYGELSAKTRQLIEENTTFIQLAESLPVFKIDKDYITKIDDLPSPVDKAAALEAALTAELAEGDESFTYLQLGDRLQRLRALKEASDKAAEDRLRELQGIANEAVKTKEEPARLGLNQPGEYGLFAVLRATANLDDDAYIAQCASSMFNHLRSHQLLVPGWSNTKGGRMRVGQSLLAESWNPQYSRLGFDPDDPSPAFLDAAVDELAKSDQG
jgi:type I restriction enzyme R subunit